MPVPERATTPRLHASMTPGMGSRRNWPRSPCWCTGV